MTNQNNELDEILHDFRQISIIIHANDSMGRGQMGADAFEFSLETAKAKIQALYAPKPVEKVNKTPKTVDLSEAEVNKPVESGELREKIYLICRNNKEYEASEQIEALLAQEKAKWNTDARLDELNNFPTTLYTPEHEYKLERLAKLLDKENV